MTRLRRHVIGIVVVCLAFAAGVALGGGPLQGADSDRAGSNGADQELAARVSALENARLLDEAVARLSAPRLLGGRLAGRSVTIVVMPGTSPETVDALRATLQSADAVVSITAQLAPDLLDPAKKTYVDSVATNSATGDPRLAASVTGETYERIGTLIARAYVGSGADTVFDTTATNVDAELQGAQLVAVEGSPGRRGSLVIMVGPADSDDKAAITALRVIQTALVTSLVKGSDGFLLVQPPRSAPGSGVNRSALADTLADDAALADDSSWSTLDVAEGTAAQVVAVHALAAAAAGKGGSFGVDGDEVVLPPGLVAPTD